MLKLCSYNFAFSLHLSIFVEIKSYSCQLILLTFSREILVCNLFFWTPFHIFNDREKWLRFKWNWNLSEIILLENYAFTAPCTKYSIHWIYQELFDIYYTTFDSIKIWIHENHFEYWFNMFIDDQLKPFLKTICYNQSRCIIIVWKVGQLYVTIWQWKFHHFTWKM